MPSQYGDCVHQTRTLIRLGLCSGCSRVIAGRSKIVGFVIYRLILASLRENLILLNVNNRGTDQHGHICRLIGAFVIHSPENIINNIASGKKVSK